jgi:hypothetical protein
MTFQLRSIPRHTAQKQRIDVLIHYRHHPRGGERVVVVREVRHAGSLHFAVDLPDGTRGLLPEWMTEPSAARMPLVEVPTLPLTALRTLRATINARLLTFAPTNSSREDGSDVGATIESTSGPSTSRGNGRRARKAVTRNPGDSHLPSETTPDRVLVGRGRSGVAR